MNEMASPVLAKHPHEEWIGPSESWWLVDSDECQRNSVT